MKNFVFATLMCFAAVSAKAQVITSDVVNHTYDVVTNQTNGKYVYNADYTGNDITTMYVYKVVVDSKDMVLLTPYLKYDYTYSPDGLLTSREVSRWMVEKDDWVRTSRFDYTLTNDSYCTAYSRFNYSSNCFEQPVEKMEYSLVPDENVNVVSYYQRNNPSSDFQLISKCMIEDTELLFAQK